MDSARNAINAPDRPAPTPAGLPVVVRRALGGMLLVGTMWLAGVLALWRAVAETIRW